MAELNEFLISSFSGQGHALGIPLFGLWLGLPHGKKEVASLQSKPVLAVQPLNTESITFRRREDSCT